MFSNNEVSDDESNDNMNNSSEEVRKVVKVKGEENVESSEDQAN